MALVLTISPFIFLQGNAPGPEVSELIKALKNPDPFTRQQAANALAAIGPRAKDAEAQLASAVQDRNSLVCRAAARALAALGATSEDALEGLRRALRDDDLGVRLAAARALTDLAPHQVSIVKALTAVALGTQVATKPKAKKEITRDTARERDDLIELRVQALRALAAIGKAAEPAVNPLTGLLGDPGANIRRETIHTLLAVGVGGDPETVTGPLLPLLQDKSLRVRLHAADALRMLKFKGKPLLPVLDQALKSQDAGVRYEAVSLVADWGKEAEPALDILKGMLTNPKENPSVRRAVAVTMTKLDKHTVLVNNYLRDTLKKERDPAVHGETLLALTIVPLPPEEKLKLAQQSLKEFSTEKKASAFVQQQALRTIGSLGAAAKEAIPVLQKLLESKLPVVRLEAALALVRIDPENQKPAVQLLTKELARPGKGERLALIAALGETLAGSKTLQKELGELYRDLAVNDPEPAVRRKAARIVGKLEK